MSWPAEKLPRNMKIEQYLSRNELTDKQFLVIAFETVKYLGGVSDLSQMPVSSLTPIMASIPGTAKSLLKKECADQVIGEMSSDDLLYCD